MKKNKMFAAILALGLVFGIGLFGAAQNAFAQQNDQKKTEKKGDDDEKDEKKEDAKERKNQDKLMREATVTREQARAIGVYRRSDLPVGTCDTCLGLWRLADPGNVGTLVRTADAFGAAVALSDGCADPLGPKALRASAGAVFRVPLLAWDDAPGERVALVARGGRPLAELELAGPVTFLLGAEREGLPAEALADAVPATIPTPGPAESLNVAVAGAIALYERSRR